MTQTFLVGGPMPGLNEVIAAAKGSGGRGAGYSRLKRSWTEAVWAHAKAAKLKPMSGRVMFSFEWRERNMRRDPDNIAAAGRKLIFDGLVTAGVLPGDGWGVVAGWEDRFVVTNFDLGVRVTMTGL